LVKLGISKDKVSTNSYEGKDHYFCCEGCLDLFVSDHYKYLEETNDLIVCPTCLAEKPRQWATKLNVGGQDVHFCRCTHCADLFQKDPDFYMKRMEGTVPNEGMLGHDGCCIAPE